MTFGHAQGGAAQMTLRLSRLSWEMESSHVFFSFVEILRAPKTISASHRVESHTPAAS